MIMEKLNLIPKMVITGHREGIGRGIADAFSLSYRVVGYDLQDGKNITDQTVWQEFIEDCENANVIILNAHTSENHLLLSELYQTYKDQDKLCIVFGSLVTQMYTSPADVPAEWGFGNYWQDKKRLDEMTSRITWKLGTNQGSNTDKFRVTMIRPGWVDTKLAKEWTGATLPVEAVVNTVRHIIVHKTVWHIPTIEVQIRDV